MLVQDWQDHLIEIHRRAEATVWDLTKNDFEKLKQPTYTVEIMRNSDGDFRIGGIKMFYPSRRRNGVVVRWVYALCPLTGKKTIGSKNKFNMDYEELFPRYGGSRSHMAISGKEAAAWRMFLRYIAASN